MGDRLSTPALTLGCVCQRNLAPRDTEMWPPLRLMNVSPGVFT
jgi:hypothetical protein